MSGFPLDAWALLLAAVVPGMALAVWNAHRGRRSGAPASGGNRGAERGETDGVEGREDR